MSVRLGAVTGVVHHGSGVLTALRVGDTVSVTPELLHAIARDPLRLRDLQHHLLALEGYVDELDQATVPITHAAPKPQKPQLGTSVLARHARRRSG